jgi:hypothetical protein
VLLRLKERPELVAGLALLLGLGAALVAATWLVARASLQSRIAAQEREIAFLRSTRDIDIPRLLEEFGTFVGTANARLELEKLQAEHGKVRKELEQARGSLAELRKERRLEEQFSLQVGQSRTILNGTVVVGLVGLGPSYADVSFAGSPENNWRVGEYRDVNLGGSRYRVLLEAIPATEPRAATFRVDALPAPATEASGPTP